MDIWFSIGLCLASANVDWFVSGSARKLAQLAKGNLSDFDER